MFIGLLSFTLLIRGATSIKDKRRVVNSVKAKLHREHQCSVAEVGSQAVLDRMDAASMALTIVNRDQHYLRSVLDKIDMRLAALASINDAELRSTSRIIFNPDDAPESFLTEEEEPIWTEQDKRDLDSLT